MEGSTVDETKAFVKFEPQGNSVTLPAGSTIREAAKRAGIPIDYPCGGTGTCGKCRVRVMGQLMPPTDAERFYLSAEELGQGMRLACQSRVRGRMTVHVPETSLLASEYQIYYEPTAAIEATEDPATHKHYVQLSTPTLEDSVADLDRLQGAVGFESADFSLLKELPRRLRDWEFQGTAVLNDHRLIDFEHGDTSSECYAAAFDIGTTTLVCVLYDMNGGTERATTARINPQTSYGDDVLSRILHATQGAAARTELQQSVIQAVNEMLDQVVESAGISRERIYELTFSGNTTMQHLLTGLDPSALGQLPFIPASGQGLSLPASELGIHIHPRGQVYVFPVIGSFLGGDTVSGMLATKLDTLDGSTLFIDIGTNGELVLLHDGKLQAASCAAGPAFEGARITHGMRAALGAIEKVHFNDDVDYLVIGRTKPVGLCGSALIDTVAEMLRYGMIMTQGLLLEPDDLPDTVPPRIRERVGVDEKGAFFVLARGEETQSGDPVKLNQHDIRELQLATGAIRTGIRVLLKRAGLAVADLTRVLVAGGFGNYIELRNAQRIGLLPHELREDQFNYVGNTSLKGARLALSSQQARKKAEYLARTTMHIELALDPNFQMEFMEAMFFPESD
jgi:uncharacterized 2Fe-2S/4Fe-4S cluster protein (DUF4445 family)